MTLFLNFKQQAEVLFIDKQSNIAVASDKKYHIVLSPTLYWIKREKLPLKYIYEVKKIAPTLFEEVLPEGEYSFYVYKEEDAFILFAYKDRELLDLLEEKGITSTNIATISFAQTALVDDGAVEVNDTEVIIKKDGLVISLPSSWFPEKKPLKEVALKPANYTIHLEQFSHFIDRKTLYKLGIILFLFICIVAAEYYYYSKSLMQITQQKEALFKEYKLKPTVMQNEAILQSYKKVAQQQTKLRKRLDDVLHANLKKGEKLTAVQYKKGVLELTFEGLKKSDIPRVLSTLYKEKLPVKVSQSADKIHVKVSL